MQLFITSGTASIVELGSGQFLLRPSLRPSEINTSAKFLQAHEQKISVYSIGVCGSLDLSVYSLWLFAILCLGGTWQSSIRSSRVATPILEAQSYRCEVLRTCTPQGYTHSSP